MRSGCWDLVRDHPMRTLIRLQSSKKVSETVLEQISDALEAAGIEVQMFHPGGFRTMFEVVWLTVVQKPPRDR